MQPDFSPAERQKQIPISISKEGLFSDFRVLAHFAVDPEQVYFASALAGKKTEFVPFNRGCDGGAGNPPSATGFSTAYLWEDIWSRPSLLDLLQRFIQVMPVLDDKGRDTGKKRQIFPRYHQLTTVREVAGHARQCGAGHSYLNQHSAGSGKTLEGIIVSWNAAAERLYGYSATEAVGASISILLPPGRNEDLPQILERLRHGERISHLETTRRTKDGRSVDVSVTISPIKNEAGEIVGASSIARDITARKQAEHEQHRLIRELQAALLHVKTLRGLLPICSACKKIRDDDGYWNQIESYIAEHSDAQFTHGLCPDCLQKYLASVDTLAS